MPIKFADAQTSYFANHNNEITEIQNTLDHHISANFAEYLVDGIKVLLNQDHDQVIINQVIQNYTDAGWLITYSADQGIYQFILKMKPTS